MHCMCVCVCTSPRTLLLLLLILLLLPGWCLWFAVFPFPAAPISHLRFKSIFLLLTQNQASVSQAHAHDCNKSELMLLHCIAVLQLQESREEVLRIYEQSHLWQARWSVLRTSIPCLQNCDTILESWYVSYIDDWKGNRYKWIKKMVVFLCPECFICRMLGFQRRSVVILQILLVYKEIVNVNTLVDLSVFWTLQLIVLMQLN